MPATALGEGLANAESGNVEIVQDEQPHAVGREAVDQLTRRRDAHALRRHDGDVEALLDLSGAENRREAFLLDEQGRAVASLRARGHDVRRSDPRLDDLRIAAGREVVAHRKGAEPDLKPGVGLAEVTAVVPDDVPVDARLLDVVDEQRLAEIMAVERFFAGHFENRAARGVIDLPRIGWQRPIGGGGEVGFFHDRIGSLFESDGLVALDQRVPALEDGAQFPLVSLALRRPFTCGALDSLGECSCRFMGQ